MKKIVFFAQIILSLHLAQSCTSDKDVNEERWVENGDYLLRRVYYPNGTIKSVKRFTLEGIPTAVGENAVKAGFKPGQKVKANVKIVTKYPATN